MTELLRQQSKRVLQKHANAHLIANGLKLLECETFIPAKELAADPELINLKNGMLHWPTMRLLDHDPKYRSRIQLNAALNYDAESPRWLRFLDEIFPEDAPGQEGWKKALCLQVFLGTCLLPDTRTHRCLFLLGEGANGKSTLIKTLTHIFRRENVANLSIPDLNERFRLAMLKDKLLNLGDEIGSKRTETTNFKRAVSGDALLGENKHGDPFQFVPTAKHIFVMNRLPHVVDHSHGFTRRPILIKFNRIFEEVEWEKGLEEMLKSEADGIFLWMLQGLNYFMKGAEYRGAVIEPGQLYLPQSVRKAHQALVSADIVRRFLDDCCTCGAGQKEKRADIWKAFKIYNAEAAERKKPQREFYQDLDMRPEFHFKRQEGRDRAARYVGISLNEEWRNRIQNSDRNGLF